MLHLIRLVSLRHLALAPLRSALTVLGVAVGVATLVGVTTINRSVLEAFRSTVDTIAGTADLTVAGAQTGFPESLVDVVKAVPGVLHASAGLSEIAPVHASPGESLYVMGVDFLDDGFFRKYEAVGRDFGQLADDLELLNSTDRMLVSERFARAHRLAVGDIVRLVTSSGAQDFTVHALIKETGPIKAFGGAVGIMFLGSAQEAFHRPATIDRIDVAVDPAVGVDEVRARVVRAVGPAYEVERPARRGGSVARMVRGFQMGLNLASGMALLVGVFLVYNTVAIGVVQRRREIGTLRALGADRRRVRALFTLEAAVMGAAGTALGLPLGVWLSRVAVALVSRTISSVYVHVNVSDVRAAPLELMLGAVLGVGGSMLAALQPAVAASAVPPVEALRRDIAAGAQGERGHAVAAGLGLLALALAWPASRLPAPVEGFPVGGYAAVFCVMAAATLVSPRLLRALHRVHRRMGEWLLGISGALAADNFSRAPGRTAVPVSALALGVAMTVGIAGFVRSFQLSSVRWIEQSVPADLFITSSSKLGGVSNRPMRPDLTAELRTWPEVRGVDEVRLFPHDVLGLRVLILSYHADIYARQGRSIVLEGRLPTADERRAGKLAISENLSRRRGLHPGDTFPMATPTGLRTYTVSAVVQDYSSDQGAVLMDRAVFVDHFQDDRVDTFELYLADLSRIEDVRRTVTARFGERYQLYVLTNRELREEARRLIDGAFSVTYAMEAVAVLLALLGIINTLLAAVLDRTREIGLLRAVGASRAQVVRMFVGEAGFIGLSGALLGAAAGLFMGQLVTHVIGIEITGWSLPYLFPYGIALQMLGATTACAILAGLYPARRAAHLDIVEALAYE